MDNQSFLQSLREGGDDTDIVRHQSKDEHDSGKDRGGLMKAVACSVSRSGESSAVLLPPHSKRACRAEFRGCSFALVICRHPTSGKFLAVNETDNRGWSIPGGGVDATETFAQAAMRETVEEAGVEVELKGILKVEHISGDGLAHPFYTMRVYFYAEPKDVHDCVPKSVADHESLGAEWLTPREFQQKKKIRGNELLEYASRVENGKIYPLELLDEGV